MIKNKTILFLLLIIILIVSLPILQAGFFNDDVQNSSAMGAAELLHQHAWSYIWRQSMYVSLGSGRLFPITAFTQVLASYYFSTPLAYQTLHVIAIWLSVISMAWLVQLITKNMSISLFFILLFPVYWSMRNMADALLSFSDYGTGRYLIGNGREDAQDGRGRAA